MGAASREIALVTCPQRFFGQARFAWESMDLDILRHAFEDAGYLVKEYDYERLVAGEMGCRDAIVVYSSSQTPGYREFIEDVLLALEYGGNILVPSFRMFRAHENKGFQELMKRDIGLSSISARYGCGMPPQTALDKLEFPAVLKWVDGSRGTGVKLVDSSAELARQVQRFERLPLSTRLYAATKKRLFPARYIEEWYEYIRPRKRFVLQEFVPGLTHDFKVLAFGDTLFVLRRGVRKGDFRASGSGLREFIEPDQSLLDYAWAVHQAFNEPFLSMDICSSARGYDLIEFQGIHFGPFTLLDAPFAYRRMQEAWEKVQGPFSLEQYYANAILSHLRSQCVDTN